MTEVPAIATAAAGAPVPDAPDVARALSPGSSASAQTAPPAPKQTEPGEVVYRLRAGDLLRVVLYFHPNLTQELQIRPDGRIAFPLAGDLVAAGRTPAELGQELTSRLEVELRNADATVIVLRFADLRVYIGGEVNNPGVYPLVAPTTTLQALLQAGGTKRTASLGSVFVIRNQDGAPSILRLDLRQSKLSEIGTAHHEVLQPLDVVFVPKSGIAKVNDFVDQYITKVIPATVVLGLNYNFGNLFLPSK
jgi:protein involved in polysaccharide export with SLBB domain